jgi:uncharacterized protein YggE
MARYAVHALVAATLLAGAAVLPALAQEDKDEGGPVRTITLSANGVATAAPDTVIVSLGVVTQGDTAAAALAENNRAMTETLAGLRDAGIEERDIQTSNFSINPNYSYPQAPDGTQLPPEIVNYQVSNQVTVRIRDIADAGGLLDSVVAVGANSVQGISFTIDDPSELMDNARRDALEEARSAAEVYAAAANVTLGDIIAISEGGGYQPQPVMMFREADAQSAAAPAVPLAGGEQEVTANVTVTWTLQ